jgi:hypothetical protein
MTKRTIAVLVLCAAPLLLAGCDSLRDAAGLTKKPLDEFAVTTKAPLVIPPDFNLRPPSPGAAPTNQQDPTVSAQMALFNSSDPQTVANNMTGNFTPAEKLLLANAGAQNADPGIRSRLQSDQRAMQAADPGFTDRVLGRAATPVTDAPVNVPSKGAPKESGGWFDWF